MENISNEQVKIDWKRPWLKEVLEDARKECEARPDWMKKVGRARKGNVISKTEEESLQYWD